jgi:hypothetical protein
LSEIIYRLNWKKMVLRKSQGISTTVFLLFNTATVPNFAQMTMLKEQLRSKKVESSHS